MEAIVQGYGPQNISSADQVRHDLTADLGVPLHSSDLLRAAVKILIHSRREVRQAARRAPTDNRPANNDAEARAEFHEKLARLFFDGIRKAPDMG
ncbi:MAG: hypothetical protein ACE5F1_08580 [Planctomycetota bacterium]